MRLCSWTKPGTKETVIEKEIISEPAINRTVGLRDSPSTPKIYDTKIEQVSNTQVVNHFKVADVK